MYLYLSLSLFLRFISVSVSVCGLALALAARFCRCYDTNINRWKLLLRFFVFLSRWLCRSRCLCRRRCLWLCFSQRCCHFYNKDPFSGAEFMFPLSRSLISPRRQGAPYLRPDEWSCLTLSPVISWPSFGHTSLPCKWFWSQNQKYRNPYT